MNIIIIQKLLSVVYLAIAFALMLCMVGGLFMGESLASTSIQGFISSIIITFFLAVILKLNANKFTNKYAEGGLFFRREALCTIGLTWLSTSFIGAFPFYLGLDSCSFVNALFESTSGITGTGATIFDDFEILSPSLFLWRSLSQWIGGLGVVVFFVAILTSLGAGAKVLFSNESSVASSDFEQGRIQSVVFKLLIFYCTLTSLCIGSYKIGGMSWFDAFNHGMTTIATGGFSTHQESFAYFNSPLIESISIIFMLLSATTFIYLIKFFQGTKGIIKSGTEIYIFYLLAAISISIISFIIFTSQINYSFLDAFRNSAFQATSIITTTGYTSVNYDLWGTPAKVILMFLMLIGGCSGSTSGGIKIIRVVTAFKAIFRAIEQTYRPNKTIITRIGSKIVNDAFINNVIIYIVLIFTIQGFSVIVLSFLEPSLSLISLFSSVQSCLYNIGPGFDAVGPMQNFNAFQGNSKFFLSFLMILGRLEIFALIVLFIPKIWRTYS